MLEQAWLSFRDRALTDGSLIERVITMFYKSILLRSENAIDGGAHQAYHTLPLAACVPEGKVVAVEPNPAMFSILEANVKGRSNVVLERAALVRDHAQRSVTFNISSSHPGRSSVSRVWDKIAPGIVEYKAEEVPATTIDNIVAAHRLTSLAFVKLDLEGGEFPALLGGEKSLTSLRPTVVCEHASQAFPLNGFEFHDYLAFLDRIDYVAMAPNGSRVTNTNRYPFWYVVLYPAERLALATVMEQSLAAHV